MMCVCVWWMRGGLRDMLLDSWALIVYSIYDGMCMWMLLLFLCPAKDYDDYDYYGYQRRSLRRVYRYKLIV